MGRASGGQSLPAPSRGTVPTRLAATMDYRGGMSLRRDYRLLESEATLQVRADRRAFRPYGLQGGRPGRASQNFLATPLTPPV